MTQLYQNTKTRMKNKVPKQHVKNVEINALASKITSTVTIGLPIPRRETYNLACIAPSSSADGCLSTHNHPAAGSGRG